MANKHDDLTYEVDLETGLTRVALPHIERAYEPPPKTEHETQAQVHARLQRQRRHQLDLDITDLRNKAASASTEYERLLARHQALEPIEGPDPVRTNLYVEVQTQRRLAAWYRKRAARLEQRRDGTPR